MNQLRSSHFPKLYCEMAGVFENITLTQHPEVIKELEMTSSQQTEGRAGKAAEVSG